MALMTWSGKHSVGVNALDSQHKTLMRVLNELHAASMQGKVREIAGPLLRLAVSLANEHFSDEERLMETTRYPGLASPPRKGRLGRLHPVALLLAGLADQPHADRGSTVCSLAALAWRKVRSLEPGTRRNSPSSGCRR